MITLVLSGLETAINTALRLDPDTLKRLARLSGKTIAIDLPDWRSCFYMQPGAEGVTLLSESPPSVDTTLRGDVFGLLRMGLGAKATPSSSVDIEGDIELGQTLRDILQAISIDWEEHLSHVVGDVIAHQVGNVVRESTDWFRRSGESLRKNMTEYLQEEIRHMPPREELQHFLNDIDALRDQVDRAEARLHRLKISKAAS